jgi:hypothetical protein
MDSNESMWSDNLAKWNLALDRNSYFTGKAHEDKQKKQFYNLSPIKASALNLFLTGYISWLLYWNNLILIIKTKYL